MQTGVKAVCGGIVAALLAFVPSFMLFDRILIAYWEFTLGADERALLLALFFAVPRCST
jgi:hypothetical protein